VSSFTTGSVLSTVNNMGGRSILRLLVRIFFSLMGFHVNDSVVDGRPVDFLFA
jgi:hypothetical protein